MVNTLFVVAIAATLAPLVAAALGRLVRIPVVVVEIMLGIVIGPSVLNLVSDLSVLNQLSQLGLVMLFFMAGNEIDFARIRGRPMRRSLIGWTVSIVGGVLVGLLVESSVAAAVYVGIALSSTSLGTLVPVLTDTGRLRSPFGVAVTAVGAAGEFAPLAAISIFLSSRQPASAAAILLGFVVLAVAAVVTAAHGRHLRLQRFISATLHTSGQFAVRLVLLIVAALVALSTWLQLDLLLGAFAAGVVVQYLQASASPSDARQVESKLEAVAFGLLVPIFFIATGVTFDAKTLFGEPRLLLLVGLFFLALLVLRGLTGLLSSPSGADRREQTALVLMTATGLPIIVAVTSIAQKHGELSSSISTALIAAGMLTVLLLPTIATTVLGKNEAPQTTEDAVDDATW